MNFLAALIYRAAVCVICLSVFLVAIDIYTFSTTTPDSGKQNKKSGLLPSQAQPEKQAKPSDTVLIPDFLTTESESNSESETANSSETENDTETETTPPETEKQEIIDQPVLPIYIYNSQLGESAEVDDSYFSKALFIGDSRTIGFCNFTNISPHCYARVSLNVKSVLTTAFVEDFSTEPATVRTVADAIRAYPDSFDKVYIGFGINEYGMASNVFISCYKNFIGELIDILPEGTPIYIQSILPINETKAKLNGYRVKNYQLSEFNDLLAEMCTQYENVHFVNIAEAVITEDSFTLPADASNDGIHMNKSTCEKIKYYLYTHTAEAA